MENITLYMVYHPTISSIYNVLHCISFSLSTTLSSLAMWIVLKKSTPAMGTYKYVLLNQLFWTYLAELIMFLWQPVPLIPYFAAYSKGILKYLPPQYFFGVAGLFAFDVFAIAHSIYLALIYRISILFDDTAENFIVKLTLNAFRDKKLFAFLYILFFVLMEVILLSK